VIPEGRERELKYFLLLRPEEQRLAIARLSDQGMGVSSIASATALNIEVIRQIMGERTTQ
jgi:hypothetical protein